MDNNEVVTEEVAAVVENNTGIEIEPLFEEYVDFDTFSKSDFRVVKVKNCEAVPKSKKLLRFTLDDGTENERTILSGVHAFYEPEELVGKTLLAIVNLPPRSMMGIDSWGTVPTFYPADSFCAVSDSSGKVILVNATLLPDFSDIIGNRHKNPFFQFYRYFLLSLIVNYAK